MRKVENGNVPADDDGLARGREPETVGVEEPLNQLRRYCFRFANALENDVRKVGFVPDTGGVPDEFAFFFGGIPPGWLTFFIALLHDPFGLA